jgi:hypothetical protein
VPLRNPDRTTGGAGSGAVCAVCDEPVMRHMTELELEFNWQGAQSAEVYRLHHRCFAAFEIERMALRRVSDMRF